MKKLLSVVLAAASVATVGVVAFAEDYDFSGDLTVYYDSNDKTVASDNTDTVTPDQKVYVKLSEVASKIDADYLTSVYGVSLGTGVIDDISDLLNDDDYFKFSYKKGSDNSKMITGIKLVEKNIGAGRQPYIEIALADDWTDDEYKINPTFTFTVKDDIIQAFDGSNNYVGISNDEDRIEVWDNATGYTTRKILNDGDKFEGEFTLWISNTELEADEDFAAGTGGVTLKPTKNDDNEIIWYDENDDIAMLTFEGDSSVDNFFPKLSTKWDNATYAEYFADQDAFIFDFISNPDISSTSRPVLTIYDPYYDYEEDESLVDSENVVIYQVVDGELVDVTADWSYGETDDGEMAYTTKTRQLGTYIFCEVAVAGSEEVVEEPVDDGKVIPNTGR